MTSRDTTRTHGSLFGSGILRGPWYGGGGRTARPRLTKGDTN